MQVIMETIFDVAYLVTVITLGIVMLRRAAKNRAGSDALTVQKGRLFGIMTLILGCGDAFHLVPRIYALWTNGFETQAAALGIGKLITSITMTIFYILLYHVWVLHYTRSSAGEPSRQQKGPGLAIALYVPAALRIILCLFPQNEWLRTDAPLSWGIYRNIPFVVMGIIIIVLFVSASKKYRSREQKTDPFRFMGLAIVLSFAFYIPVVLWADLHPLIGMLMLPKTCAYLWMVAMGFRGIK